MLGFLLGMRAPSAPRTTIPRIDQDRCLLTAALPVACDRCARACPRDAIVEDLTTLGIDTDACTGCGLCQPACPQGAIAVLPALPVRNGVAQAACNAPGASRPLVACVHGIDLATLAQAHRMGARILLCRTGVCDTCAYGQGGWIGDTVVVFNQIAETRGQAPIRLLFGEDDCTGAWSDGDPDIDASRRRFLAGLAGGAPDFEHTRRVPLLDLLQCPGQAEDATAFQLAVPVIDTGRCDGCGVCTRICPEGALTLADADDGRLAIDVRPSACTGCRLCIACCEPGAVTVSPLAFGRPLRIELESATCPSCGAKFHSHHAVRTGTERCRICARVDPRARLFKVLE